MALLQNLQGSFADIAGLFSGDCRALLRNLQDFGRNCRILWQILQGSFAEFSGLFCTYCVGLFCGTYMALLWESQGSFTEFSGTFENTAGLFCGIYRALLRKYQFSFKRL